MGARLTNRERGEFIHISDIAMALKICIMLNMTFLKVFFLLLCTVLVLVGFFCFNGIKQSRQAKMHFGGFSSFSYPLFLLSLRAFTAQ